MLNLLKRKRPKTIASKEHLPHPEDQISRIVSGILKQNGSCKSLLLAANRIDDLPVTTPVKLAAELSSKGKCLLVDLDYKRNSIARVFDINSPIINTDLRVSPIRTPLENVDLWPSEFFSMLKQMNLRSLLESAQKKYDYIILYAPYLTTLVDRKQIASCAGHAITFELIQKEQKEKSQLGKLFEYCKCPVLLTMEPLS